MQVAASRIFAFLEQHGECAIRRYEVGSTHFAMVRKEMHRLALRLAESDDEQTGMRLAPIRAVLGEWLTSPIEFDVSQLDVVQEMLGPTNCLAGRWGHDISDSWKLIQSELSELAKEGSPLRQQVQALLLEALSNRDAFRIYCHRQSRKLFDTLLPAGLAEAQISAIYMHSVRDYRDAAPFGVLFKVGPLRSRGWGAAPDAVLSAPRFATLVQVAWSNSADEDGFGYDPAVARTAHGGPVQPGDDDADRSSSRIRWARSVIQVGDECKPSDPSDMVDEFVFFQTIRESEQIRKATLVQVDEMHGILYPPHADVLSFDPSNKREDAVARRALDSALREGMFIIMPILGDVDLGAVRAKHGEASRVWKERLRAELIANPYRLAEKLHMTGLDLVSLPSALRNWCRPPTTVIHAPRQLDHFRILLEALGVGDGDDVHQGVRRPFWQIAWNEIRRSRGEAIQAGVQEHDLIEDHLLAILRGRRAHLQGLIQGDEGFRMDLPPGSDVEGTLAFLRVCAIETGLLAPSAAMRVIAELKVIDQWRA